VPSGFSPGWDRFPDCAAALLVMDSRAGAGGAEGSLREERGTETASVVSCQLSRCQFIRFTQTMTVRLAIDLLRCGLSSVDANSFLGFSVSAFSSSLEIKTEQTV
jgi:hypothetical protein